MSLYSREYKPVRGSSNGTAIAREMWDVIFRTARLVAATEQNLERAKTRPSEIPRTTVPLLRPHETNDNHKVIQEGR